MQYDASLQNVIKFGDLLRLFHMEEEAFLVGHIVDTDLRRRDDFALTETVNEKLEALYERSFVNVGETVQMPHRMFVGLRNSGAKRKSRTKHSVQSIWEIHNDKGALGGPVAFSQTVRLRHFATGAFLCIRERKTASGAGTGNNEAMVLPQLVTPEDEADTLFAFEYVSNNEAPSGGGGAGDISGGAGGGSSGSSALESSLTAGSGEGSSSSDNGSGVYLSLHALMRLVHVTTREYVTAGLRAGSDGHPAGSVADGNGSDTGSALSGSATGTANSGQGGAGGVMVGGLLKSLQFKGPGGNVNYDDGDDNVRDANDAIRENDDLAALAGTRTLLLQKERAIRTAQDNPDECVYQFNCPPPPESFFSCTYTRMCLLKGPKRYADRNQLICLKVPAPLISSTVCIFLLQHLSSSRCCLHPIHSRDLLATISSHFTRCKLYLPRTLTVHSLRACTPINLSNLSPSANRP